MKIDDLYYCQYLLSSPINYTLTNLAKHSGGQQKYRPIEQLTWSDVEQKQGKIIKINKFPRDKKVKLFRVTASNSRTEYVATNDLTQSSIDAVKSQCEHLPVPGLSCDRIPSHSRKYTFGY